MHRILYVFLFMLLSGPDKLYAQVLPTFGNSRTGGSGMQFLKLAPDARSLSMGNTGVATSQDLSAIYWNPAGIANLDTGKVIAMLGHTLYFGDVQSNFAAVAKRVGKLSSLAIGVMSMQYGTMNETTEFDPKGTGRTFSVSNYAVNLTYSRILTQNFSFGLNGKFANEGFAGVQINNVLFDLGLLYNIGVRNARFGVSFSNFGFNVSPSGSVTLIKFSGEQELNNFTAITVPALFRIGASFDPYNKGDHRISVSGQLNHPTDNNETYALASEYSYLNLAFFRTGYEFKSDAGYAFPSVGVGVKINWRFLVTRVDYGFLAKNTLGNINRLTLSFTWK